MSVEDTLIISTLLGRAKNRGEELVALRIYDEVRRPRTQRIVESSRGTGVIEMGRGDGTWRRDGPRSGTFKAEAVAQVGLYH